MSQEIPPQKAPQNIIQVEGHDLCNNFNYERVNEKTVNLVTPVSSARAKVMD